MLCPYATSSLADKKSGFERRCIEPGVVPSWTNSSWTGNAMQRRSQAHSDFRLWLRHVRACVRHSQAPAEKRLLGILCLAMLLDQLEAYTQT